jgi:hypothetical protein
MAVENRIKKKFSLPMFCPGVLGIIFGPQGIQTFLLTIAQANVAPCGTYIYFRFTSAIELEAPVQYRQSAANGIKTSHFSHFSPFSPFKCHGQAVAVARLWGGGGNYMYAISSLENRHARLL